MTVTLLLPLRPTALLDIFTQVEARPNQLEMKLELDYMPFTLVQLHAELL